MSIIIVEQEQINVIQEFIDEHGLWFEFKEFVQGKGYSMEELGFDDDL